MPNTRIIFFGDPHGRLKAMSEAAVGYRPDAVVCLGDVYCKRSRPAKGVTASGDTQALRDAGIPYRYIHGNHESDCSENWEGFMSLPTEESLHCRTWTHAGVVGAGLGGVFRQRIWWPGEEPKFATREDKLRATQKNIRYKGGLHFKDVTSIYPEDFADLLRASAKTHGLSFLVLHEAPDTHELGFPALTTLARGCGTPLVIHGHHHRDYEATTPCGITVRGLALGGMWLAEFNAGGKLVRSEDLGEVKRSEEA